MVLKVTQMGFELARETRVTLISRVGGKHYFVYHDSYTHQLDAKPGESLVDRINQPFSGHSSS